MISNRLKNWRHRHGKGISKAHLARMVGVSRSYITKIEQGKQHPSARIMFRIADYFGCRVEDIFKYMSDTKRRQ
jgi:putative transcriptional regulator